MTASHGNASSVLSGYYSSAAQAYERWWASALNPVADAATLPFAATSYDIVVMAFVLFHVPEPQAALHEV